ncbi:MAG TPA: RNA polymerase sigma-54 factor [Micavibrio sp.]|nr:RNA polymerase sigma-54 factor [Rhodovulum sp.]HIF25816.1 RNA polymerase factor sigma-54 [Micavibrio sp.]HIL29547.1 RNA polymerase sigma-54 factor [Micavibrio sp.]
MSNISQKLDLRQSQTLTMTPQMQQAIKILQLNNVELSEMIEEELAQNPLLEKDESDQDREGDDTEAYENDTRDDMAQEFDEAWTGNESDDKSPREDFDAGSSMANIGAGGNHSFDDADSSFENQMSREVTLREHLQEQLHVAFSDPRDRMIGAGLIDLLDEGGYLREGIDELAERLGCKTERIENILPILKQFDPTGVFAADLKECLALQLEEQNRLDDPMRELLDNLDMIASYDHKKLADKCGVNETYLSDMIDEIRTLNPKPATLFDHLVVQTALPDVLMKRLPKNLGGGWRVELNHDTLPKVLINNDYYIEVSKTAKDKKDRQYLDEQLNSANWLVRAMDQRAKTILKVAGEIIEEQEAFFLYGVEFLRPMTLKDIAEKIDMHESTVSRVTNNKYIGTPRGILELKYFFSTALGDGDGAHSAEAVKAKIKNLIDAEKPGEILSDDKIVEILTAEGVDIARRTVAKYREAMHIGSSVQRRKQKKAELSE